MAKAKKNIESLRGWDYFTMPNYIVFYSWDFEKPSAQTKSKKEAEFYSERLEKMRALYLEAYPLDETGTKAVMPDPASIPSLSGPITGGAKPVDASAAKKAESEEEAGEQLGKPRFSVFRLCATYDQFRKYGNTSGGSIPLALDEAFQAGQINRGDTILMCGFGAGLTWGTSLFRW